MRSEIQTNEWSPSGNRYTNLQDSIVSCWAEVHQAPGMTHLNRWWFRSFVLQFYIKMWTEIKESTSALERRSHTSSALSTAWAFWYESDTDTNTRTKLGTYLPIILTYARWIETWCASAKHGLTIYLDKTKKSLLSVYKPNTYATYSGITIKAESLIIWTSSRSAFS